MADAATKSMALWVVRTLREAGHEALFAGGCVRDMLLGRRCHDFDVATDASPHQVKALFDHVLLIGAKFGVAMVIRNRRKVEVTTFRSDLSYTDGRHPDGVQFATAREDAQRRDFTINGMFLDPISEQVIDYVGGQEDLKRRVLRTIGAPRDRFGEDYLRMMRAVRFAVRLDFVLDPSTAAAVKEYADKITSISGERIFDELSKMVALESAPHALALLERLGLAREVLPELFASADLWGQAMARVSAVAGRKNVVLSLGALLMDLSPRAVSAIVRRWGGSNDLRDALSFFAGHRDDWRVAVELPLADFKRLMWQRDFAALKILWAAREKLATGHSACLRRIAARERSIDPAQVRPTPFVSGADLKSLGLAESPQLGGILRELYDAQLNEQFTSHKEALAAARAKLGAKKF